MKTRNYTFGIIIVLLTIVAVYIPFSKSITTYETTYPADLYFEEALKFLAHDSLTQAEHALKASIDYQSFFAPPHYYLAEVYVRQGELEQARVEYRKTIELDPEFYPAFYRLGSLLGTLKEYTEAILLLKRAVVLNPYYKEAYKELAHLYIEVGDFQSAERIYTTLQTLEVFQNK